jgi:four helix bundle protein
MAPMNTSLELPIIERTYDLIKWYIPKIEKFPRTQKFVLGDRIELSLLELLKLFCKASKKNEKRELLVEADGVLQEIRYLLRMTVDLHYISPKQFEYASTSIVEIGKMLGGWLKTVGR